MGLAEERARGALRFSAGALTTEDEARAAVSALARAAARLRGGAGAPAEAADRDHA
jgi:cysteine sulfinate desulfinase/cysteine desulfurase-like protein